MNRTYLITLDEANLEDLISNCIDRALKRNQPNHYLSPTDTSRYGDFNWLISLTLLPKSTARQKVAKNEIPGVVKIGKRLLFDKATVLEWINNNKRKSSEAIVEAAEASFNQRHVDSSRKGGGRIL